MSYAYWAKTDKNKQVNFMSNKFTDIGQKTKYKGEIVTITDYAIEHKPIDKTELRVEGRVIL